MSDFSLVFSMLFGPLFAYGQVTPPLNQWNISALEEVYQKLMSEAKPKRGPGPVPHATRSRDQPPPHDVLLNSVEVLGNMYEARNQLYDAIAMFRLASCYHAHASGRYCLKARVMKQRISRMFEMMGDHDSALAELREYADLDLFGTTLDAETTLRIKITYGCALLSKNLIMESVHYLSHPYLGYMDMQNESNVQTLNLINALVVQHLKCGNVGFALCMGKRLMSAFAERLKQESAPVQIFDLASALAIHLWKSARTGASTNYYPPGPPPTDQRDRSGASANYYQDYASDLRDHSWEQRPEVELFDHAAMMSDSILTQDSFFLACCVGIFLPVGTRSFWLSECGLHQTHRYLLDGIRYGVLDAGVIGKLKITTALLCLRWSRPKAAGMLRDTLHVLSRYLPPEHQSMAYFWGLWNEGPWLG